MTRENLKLVAVSVLCLTVGWTGPSVAADVVQYAKDADRVDGRHAVLSSATLSEAAGRLVAHNGSGQLPAKFIPKVEDADKVDGISSRALQFPTEVPPGQTIAGFWGVEDVAAFPNHIFGAPVQFPARLPAVPTFGGIFFTSTPTTPNCPGTVDVPSAAPDYICFYVGDPYSNSFPSDAAPGHFLTRHGAMLNIRNNVQGRFWMFGSYAYTAPG